MRRFVSVVIILASLLITSVPTSLATTTPLVVAPKDQTTTQSTTQKTTQDQLLASHSQSPINQSQQFKVNQTSIDISNGVPLVTTEQAVGKANKIVNEIYTLLSMVAPNITIVVLIVVGILAFVLREARKALLYVVIGLMIVIWAIPIVGYLVNLANI